MTAEELWTLFSHENGQQNERYEAWQFGASPDELAELTRSGIKTATSSLLYLYEIEGEALPKAGEYSVILDSHNHAVCVIKTTHVYTERFKNISKEHAWREGEGDKSLAYWRTVHADFFANELRTVGVPFDTDMLVVCEEFERVY